MKISVIIPVYNAFYFLDECICSTLIQEDVGEVLLINDRSNDGSLEKCLYWAKKDKRIIVINNDGKKGAGAARNIGLKNANFELISFLDADDYYIGDRFKYDIKTIILNNKIECLVSSVLIKNNKNDIVVGPTKCLKTLNINDFIKEDHFYITAILFWKHTLKKVGLFDEDLELCEDDDFIIKMLIKCNVVTTENLEPKIVYRRHNSNTTNNLTKSVYYKRKAFRKFLHKCLLEKQGIQSFYLIFIRYIEYDFLWLTKGNLHPKKIYKILLLPLLIYRLIFKNDMPYDKNRKIHKT